MSISKPFTFTAGTKARASEVNQDFDVLYSEVNSIDSQITSIDVSIQSLEEDKADKAGSASQTFKVANPVNSYDAVNKGSLTTLTSNTRNYIDGLVITKSDNDKINVAAGSCYDSTYAKILELDTSTQVENSGQGASATYYVYIIGANSTSVVDQIIISSSTPTPALPSGYALFRQIGSFTTDSNSKINSISSYSNSQVFNIRNVIPDYSTKTTVSNPYTVTEYCFISHYGFQGYNGGTSMSINNQTVWQTGGGLDASQGTNWISGVYLCKPGDYVSGSSTVYKYSIVGA